MSRDFILILAGGMVSLLTTLVVLYASDYIFRRDELLYRKSLPVPPMYGQPATEAMDEPQMFAEDNGIVTVEESSEEQVPAMTSSEAKTET
jgi:hypothetical protein